jgi:hypothetical protein
MVQEVSRSAAAVSPALECGRAVWFWVTASNPLKPSDSADCLASRYPMSFPEVGGLFQPHLQRWLVLA